jgi:hypothetical protein
MSAVDFEVWPNHFEYHAQHPRCIPRGLSDHLRPDERRLIPSSIATFQLGEQSEGRTLLRAAQRFAHGHRIPALARIVELFIREEQHHAALLRVFMEDHDIALKRMDWTDQAATDCQRLTVASHRSPVGQLPSLDAHECLPWSGRSDRDRTRWFVIAAMIGFH